MAKTKVQVVKNFEKRSVGRPKGYDPAKYWELFVEAGQLSARRGEWVKILEYALHHAYLIARKLRAGDFEVPGGVEKWDIEVRNIGGKKGRGERGEIVVRRKRR